ncbi:hypothetical protein GQN54_15290, partial [Cryomorphaceae bacterium S-15]|nr:hypothetical protein [Acidiluteibacter ferrifornacis]
MQAEAGYVSSIGGVSAANGISSTDDRQYTYDGTGNLKSDDSRKILDIT